MLTTMYILSTLEILQENPYTGDKITKARILHIDPSILPNTSDSTHGNDNIKVHGSNETGQDRAANPTETGRVTDDINLKDKSRTRLPGFVAIKYLSDYRTIRTRSDGHTGSTGEASRWDSSDDDSDDVTDEEKEEAPRRQTEWPLIGDVLPQGIKFGIKARREIRALKAAQGHPNIIPFLGFTRPPATNPFKPPKNKQLSSNSETIESYQGSLLTEPAPLIQRDSQLEGSTGNVNNGNDTLGVSLLGQPLGRSLFQDIESSQLPKPALPQIADTPSELFPPFCNSGFNSDYDSDLSSIEEDDEDDYNGVCGSNVNSADTTQAWNRAFLRQSRMGGIILPYIPITMQDLIQIGWTKTRPVMIETCMRQILEGLAWIHNEAGLIHRDISSNNIMVAIDARSFENNGVAEQGKDTVEGRRGIVQCMISDFGCATFHRSITAEEEGNAENKIRPHQNENPGLLYGDKASQAQDYEQLCQRGLTFEVGTRAYKAPELLFSSGNYTNAIDIWSAGVLFAEMFLGRTLFEADSDIGQVCAIVKVLGTPTELNWPEYKSMPDYGKLVFQALETNPLSSILISNNSVAESSAITSPTLISSAAFELIERMITYSGSRRPSAEEALKFKDRFLERANNFNAENRVDQQEQKQDQELLQCVIDESIILEEIQKMKAREADENEDGGGFLFGGFGGPRRERPPTGERNSESENEDNGYRSDDLTGGEYEFSPGNTYGFEEYDDEDNHTRAIKRNRTTSDTSDDLSHLDLLATKRLSCAVDYQGVPSIITVIMVAINLVGVKA
ncbi:hypothetical protein BGX27_006596 [Mortierella sp. AM989]|nr:hypothetical protein BGX27_006596 [Mortierella sp. AM989]